MKSDERLSIGKSIPINERTLEVLIDNRCAYCYFEYKSQKDLEDHGAILGYSSDIVGKECWLKYLESYGNPME